MMNFDIKRKINTLRDILVGKVPDPKAQVEQITIASNFFDILKNIRHTASDLRFGYPGSTTIGSPALDVGMISVAGK